MLHHVNAKEHSLSKSIKFLDGFGRVMVDKIEPLNSFSTACFPQLFISCMVCRHSHEYFCFFINN